MKNNKNKKIIIVLIVLVFLFAGYYLYKNIKINNLKNTYDYIVVGTSCTTQFIGGEYEKTFGIKNGTINQISNSFKKDMSNINKIVRSDDMITYFSYDTWYNMYDELGRVDYCGICSEHYNETIKKAHDKYDYKEKDLTVFNKILEIIGKKNESSLSFSYFIVTDNNYYLFTYEDTHKIFKYNEDNNSLDLLLDLGNCSDMIYFYEK